MIRDVPPGYSLDLQGTADGAALRILVVEGNGHTWGLLQDTIARGGIIVDLAREPRAALASVRERPYDVILIDLATPGVTDRELFDQIEAVDLEQSQRVVFLVHDLSDPSTRRFLTEARRPYLTHPADAADLCDLVFRIGYRNSSTDEDDQEIWTS